MGRSGVSSGWVVSHDAGQGLGQGVTMEEGSVSGLGGSGVDPESPGW